MWNHFDFFIIKVFLAGIGLLLIYYILVRVGSLAIFKSWIDAHKTTKKEEKNVIQKKSGKV